MSDTLEARFREAAQGHVRHYLATECCKAPIDFAIGEKFEDCTWRCASCGADRPEVQAGLKEGTQVLCGKLKAAEQ